MSNIIERLTIVKRTEPRDVAEVLNAAIDEIERLRATPIQWRPVDEAARGGQRVLIRLGDDDYDFAAWQKSRNNWWRDDGNAYSDEQITAYCPLTNPT